MDEILKSLLTQIKTPQTYDEYKTISESDAPGQYKDTNPYNDPTSVDEYRRNNEDTEPEGQAPGQEGQHKHHNPLTAIEKVFEWLCNEKGRLDLDPEVLSVRAELGTTINPHVLMRYLVSKGLVFRSVPCRHIGPGQVGYGIMIANSKRFQNIEVEDTLSGQTFHKETKYYAFKYFLFPDADGELSTVIEVEDPESNASYTGPKDANDFVNNELVWYLT